MDWERLKYNFSLVVVFCMKFCQCHEMFRIVAIIILDLCIHREVVVVKERVERDYSSTARGY